MSIEEMRLKLAEAVIAKYSDHDIAAKAWVIFEPRCSGRFQEQPVDTERKEPEESPE